MCEGKKNNENFCLQYAHGGGVLYTSLFLRWKDDRMKKVLVGMIIGGLCMMTLTAYAVTTLYEAREVGYDNASSGTSNTDVQGALDELYELSETHCPDGYICTKLTGVELLLSKANDASITNYEEGNKGEMYTFSHEATEQTEALTDYRYIGDQPNNYITFNNETWRIIGVIEGRIKIIKDEFLGYLAWDSEDINDWTTASLQQTLNNGTGSWKLNETATNQVDTVTWYLGGSSTYRGLSGEDYYAFERGTMVYSGRPTSWNGKVGLMYPSDYIYTYAYGVDDTCYNDGYTCNNGTPSSGWLFNSDYQWTMSPYSSNSRSVFYVYSTGYVDYSYGVTYAHGVRPVVHLRSDISLSGSGTVSDPYQIID